MISSDLLEGEEIVTDIRPTLLPFLWRFCFAFLWIVFPFFFFFFFLAWGIESITFLVGWVLLGFFFARGAWRQWQGSLCVVTNKRLLFVSPSWWGRCAYYIVPLSDILSVRRGRRGAGGRLFDYAFLVIDIAGETSSSLRLFRVRPFSRYQSLLTELVAAHSPV